MKFCIEKVLLNEEMKQINRSDFCNCVVGKNLPPKHTVAPTVNA